MHSNSSNFSLVSAVNPRQNQSDENNNDSPDVDPRGHDLHHFVRGGETELQEDTQELPNEQQEGMQLRQGLRLLVSRTRSFRGSYFSRTILPIVYPE
jgi:hypothetical protein